MSTPELIGVWSVDARYGPGAQSDDQLIFEAGGSGRMEYLNWDASETEFFHWRVVAPGVVDLGGYRSLRYNNDGTELIEAEPRFTHLGVPFTVAEEDTPSGRRMLVLRIGLPEPEPDTFGLLSR